MNRIESELVLVAKKMGDLGTTEDMRVCANNFLSDLQLYLTEQTLQLFTGEQLRPAYVAWLQTLVLRDREVARKRLAAGIRVEISLQPVEEEQQKPLPSNVVSIFG